VSPRSSEFLQAARRRLAAAEVAVEEDPSDYDAWSAPAEEARRAIELADRFLTAIEVLLD
jgi:hypothetical protein